MNIANSDIISMAEAAERLGVSRSRIRWLLLEKQLRGGKFDDMWMVSAASVEARRKELQARRDGQGPDGRHVAAASQAGEPVAAATAPKYNPAKEFANRPMEYAEFKILYKSCKGDSFRFYGQTVLKQYAKYLIEAVDMELEGRA